jgi:hypothetical protein
VINLLCPCCSDGDGGMAVLFSDNVVFARKNVCKIHKEIGFEEEL